MQTIKPRRRSKPISKKHKFIKDGIFFSEVNDFLAKELAEEGYAGCEVRVTPKRTQIIIHATKTNKVIGENGKRRKELTKLIERRFQFKEGTLDLVAQKIKNRGLSALGQAEAVRYRLFEGLSVRRACYSVVKWIMDRGAKGCEVVVSGKLRGQRAKSMKFRDGYMTHAGDPINYYMDKAVKHIHLRQGVLGIKVKIMLPHKDDPVSEPHKYGDDGVRKLLPDVIKIHDPKDIDPSVDPIEEREREIRGKLTHNTTTDIRNFQQPTFTNQSQQQQPQTQTQVQVQPQIQQQQQMQQSQFQQPQQVQQPMNQGPPPPNQQFGRPMQPQQFNQGPPPNQQGGFNPNQQGGFPQYQ